MKNQFKPKTQKQTGLRINDFFESLNQFEKQSLKQKRQPFGCRFDLY